MPSRIVVLTGRESNREIEIEAPVVSIGGDSACEICLVGESPTLATLRFRDGNFVIYNRTKATFSVDGTDLAPDATLSWRSGKIVQFASGTRLRLESSGDPRPVPKARDLGSDDNLDSNDDVIFPTGSVEIDAKAKAKSDQLTWMLIVVLLLMIWWAVPSGDETRTAKGHHRHSFQDLVYALLSRDLLEQPGDGGVASPVQIRPEFEELLKRSTPDEQPILDTLRERLQNARISELRNDRATALKQYGAVRDLLTSLGADRRIFQGATLDERSESGPETRTIYHVAYEYVVDKIGDYSN